MVDGDAMGWLATGDHTDLSGVTVAAAAIIYHYLLHSGSLSWKEVAELLLSSQ